MDEVTEVPVSRGSLRDRIAQRSRELEAKPEHLILLDVPGYEDLVAAQYRALPYREQIKIESRHEKVKDPAEQVLRVAADKLIAACERLVEKTDDPDTYEDVGCVWNSQAAEFFGKTLPENATARQALLAIFPDEEAVVNHATELEEQRREQRSKLDSVLVGESKAG